MARAYVRDVLTYGDDGTLIALANAVGLLYTDAAATVAATDAYAAASGGSAITQVTTDATGTWEVFFETAKTFYVKWTDNSDAAYPIGVPTQLKSWTPFVRRHEAIDVVDDVSLSNLTLSGTFAARPAAGTAGRVYTATWAGTQIVRRYYDTGTAWVSQDTPFGAFNPLDFGADPTGATDSRAAVVACLTAATTALDTGLPYGSGSTYSREVEWTVGQYTISSAVTLPAAAPIRMRAIGGENAGFQWGPRVVIYFTAGGFVTDQSASDAVEWDGLYVIGAPALFVDRGQGHGELRRCLLRSVTAGQPALQLRNTFWAHSYETTFEGPNTSTPSVLIESDDALGGGFEGWLFRFMMCRFNTSGIRWDVKGAHGTIVGWATLLESCDTENFGANTALLHIRNTHATEDTTFEHVAIRGCTHNDQAGDADMLKLETLGTGSLIVDSVQIENSDFAASGYHVRHVETGGGVAHADRLFIRSAADARVLFGATPAGYGALGQASGSGLTYLGDRTSAIGWRGKVNGESQDRLMVLADGTIFRGLGSASPYQKCGFFAGTGSPEGVVTATKGSLYQRTDGAAGGTCIYLKESDTTNTGWVPLPSFTADTTLADGIDLAVGTSAGTKIATATTQKLGFWNATPVVQPTAVADATDAATAISQLNALLAKLRTLGLIAT